MLALTFAVLWAVLIFPIVDGDIWFHMLYGKLMLENQSLLVDHSQFSWTPASNDTIYCAWLGQILYYLLYSRHHLVEGTPEQEFASIEIRDE